MKDSQIKVLIVDDEPLARRRIRSLLAKHSEMQIVSECSNGLEALEAIELKQPDLIFLDMQMPEMDGLTLIKNKNPDDLPFVIFVTAYNNYGLAAFDAHAVDYLLKPFDPQRFDEAIEQAKERLALKSRISGQEILSELFNRLEVQSSYLKQISIRNDGRIFLVKTENLEWIEAERNYVRLHVGEQSYLRREAISSIEAQLDPAHFRRVHRSAIVNINFIKELRLVSEGDYQIILLNGRKLVLSRSCQKNLPEFLG